VLEHDRRDRLQRVAEEDAEVTRPDLRWLVLDLSRGDDGTGRRRRVPERDAERVAVLNHVNESEGEPERRAGVPKGVDGSNAGHRNSRRSHDSIRLAGTHDASQKTERRKLKNPSH